MKILIYRIQKEYYYFMILNLRQSIMSAFFINSAPFELLALGSTMY